MNKNATELALQEFDVEQLEDLDAMDWGTSFAASLGAGATVSAAISIAALT